MERPWCRCSLFPARIAPTLRLGFSAYQHEEKETYGSEEAKEMSVSIFLKQA